MNIKSKTKRKRDAPAVKRKAQAILEMGILGSLLLFIILQLISYMQRMNDQQYLTMKAFRRALWEAYHKDWTDPSDGKSYTKGGSVTLTEIEHRRHYAGDFFGKGTRNVLSSSAYVYWGIPFIGSKDGEDGIEVEKVESYNIYNINDWRYDLSEYYRKNADADDDDDDESAENNSGLYDDLDGDGILNWKDEYSAIPNDQLDTWDANSNGILDKKEETNIALEMKYLEDSTETQTKSENSGSTGNKYKLGLKDKIDIKFVDKNAVDEEGNKGLVLPESNTQRVYRKDNGSYGYRVSTNDDSKVEKTRQWLTAK